MGMLLSIKTDSNTITVIEKRVLALPKDEKAAILKHMRAYHGGPTVAEPTFEDMLPYLPAVFEKVAGNLECYVEKLEAEEAPAKSAI